MERKHTFNEIAAAYDKYRPSYPDALFDDIANYAAIAKEDAILEIGCGTGQATGGFVQLGYDRITCVELGSNLAEFTREKFIDKPNVTIVNAGFESWESNGALFALAVSGTAFHFIQPQSFGYRKVHELLRGKGAIAFFWTAHIASDEVVFREIRDSYRRLAPQLDDSKKPTLGQIIEERSKLTLADGLFHELDVKTYEWQDSYTADEYIALLNTNSGHRLLSDDIRERLFGEMKAAIERHGGMIAKRQAVLLFLARRMEG